MKLRPATPSDIPKVMRLVRGLAEYERLAHKFVATETDYADILFGAAPRAWVTLAETDAGEAVGLALYYYTVSTFAGHSCLFLEDLFVDPAHRGSGIGLALLRHLAVKAVEEHCGSIDWRVLNWNEPAIKFYDSLGARPLHEWHGRCLDGDALIALAKGHSHG
jgi:GNAT superfamily N-acetyltransferase